MDCPTCSIANPPEAQKCDCGYDFKTQEAPTAPGWSIQLSWGQKVAAYWSICWPAWVASSVPLVLAPFQYLVEHAWILGVGMNLVFFVVQFFLTHRLVRKNYRSFRLYVIRGDREQSRQFSMREAGMVWLWLIGPQLALILIASILVEWLGDRVEPQATRSISSLSLWLRILVVGPYSVALALGAKYPGFRLQAHGYQRI